MEKASFENKSSIMATSVFETNAKAILSTSPGILLIVDRNFRVFNGSEEFYSEFFTLRQEVEKESIFSIIPGGEPLKDHLEALVSKQKESVATKISANLPHTGKREYLVKVARIEFGEGDFFLLINFSRTNFTETESASDYFRKSVQDILVNAPAMICTTRGPEHVFELANEKYLQLIGKRDIIGKTVRESLPEVKNQGFFEILDEVYATGEAFIGNEIPVSLRTGKEQNNLSYLDFIYQPTRNNNGEVDGIFVHAVDVTEQVQARKKIEESEKELRNLINTAPVILWLSKEEGHGPTLNKNWMEFTGQSEAEARDFGWLEAIHPEDREEARNSFSEADKQQTSFRTSYRLRHKNGGYRWIISRGEPKFTAEGQYDGMVGTVVDIHEEKVKEQLLIEKEHRIRSLVEEATVPTALYIGEEMKIELANDAMLEVWGKGRNVVGKRLREALPELEDQPFHPLLNEVFTTGKTYWGKEDRVDLMVGNLMITKYFNFTYKPLRNEKNEVYGILNMALDVTEMVESKNLLKESEKRFRQMADLMPEKVMKTDAEGDPIYFNQGWLQYTGSDVKQLKEEGIVNFLHPQEKEDFQRRWNYSLATGHKFEMEFRCRNREGKYKWHLTRGEALKNEEGVINRWIATTTEIQKIKEEEKRKEDFLKMVSHELKTPVTSIKGYVQLLLSILNNHDGPEIASLPIKPSLERIDHQVIRLTRLISEMLDLSRIEENKLELQKEHFSMNELVEQTVQDINYTNTQHQIDIYHDYDCTVYADKDRIGQVLINFITNAIKYSPENRSVAVHIQKAEEDFVAVRVRDRGIGIDKKNHKRIFKRFYRVGIKSEETYSGFGIGLYLAKEIIERHKGRITVESELKKGSEFSFFLQVASKDQEI